MMPYKFRRRSFILGTGAAFGLHTLLRNAEAYAQGMTAPKRLLVTHRPIGTMRYAYTPTGSGSTYTVSRILKPFEDAGLRNDYVIVDGLNMDTLQGPGGGHEKGTVVMMTACRTYGTRSGQTEQDDAMAAFPSMDQVILAATPNTLGGRPFPSIYGLVDDRIDFQEISTRCFRYSMNRQNANPAPGAVFPSGVTPYENIPLRPTLKPYDLYVQIFGSMMPGGTTGGTSGTTTGGTSGGNTAALFNALNAKKSVLDFSLSELARLRTLAPSSAREMLDAHEATIRQLENQLISMGATTGGSDGGAGVGGSDGGGGGTGGGACMRPMQPDSTLSGGVDDGRNHNNYGNDSGSTDDAPNHQKVGEAHQAIIMAAFQCDLTRCGLFQWSPGTNHVSFKGMYPGNPNLILMHHPVSHRIASTGQESMTNNDAEFCVNIEIWYNQRHAEFMNRLKAAKDLVDPNGGSLLDNTIVPYFTEVAEPTHTHGGNQAFSMPISIFGGKNLGMKALGQYVKLSNRPWPDIWLTIAQALGVTIDMLKALTVNGKMGAPILNEQNQGVITNLI